jgi:hypothetical protein
LRKSVEHIIIIAALVPLFFLNIRDTQDWGDDWAQYIHQSKNIASGFSQNETGYIFNEYCFTGPKAYPTGFPLLLKPVVHFYFDSFYHLNLYLTLFLALCGVTGFLILRLFYSFPTAFLSSLIIVYHPQLLSFKTEIVSDLPFTFFSMWCIYLMLLEPSFRRAVFIGILLAFTTHIRAVAWALLAAYLVSELVLRNPFWKSKIRDHMKVGIVTASFLLMYFILKLAYPCDVNYEPFTPIANYIPEALEKLSYNAQQLSGLFRNYHLAYYYVVGVVASAGLIAFSITGYLHFVRTHRSCVIGVYVPLYLLVIITYPYGHAGIRFMYPLLFLDVLLAIAGMGQSLRPLYRRLYPLAIVSCVLLLATYVPEIQNLQAAKDDPLEGPEMPEARETFEFINRNVTPGSVVAFDKPRVLALYTKTSSFTFHPNAGEWEMTRDISRFKAGYVLTSATQSTDNIRAFPAKDTAHFRSVFSNSQFTLYAVSGL